MKVALTQVAHAASRTKNTYLSAQYHRLAGQRGKKRAIMAVAHSILIITYHMILRQEPYHDLGGNYFVNLHPEVTAKRLLKRLEQLGFQVDVRQTSTASAKFYFQIREMNG